MRRGLNGKSTLLVNRLLDEEVGWVPTFRSTVNGIWGMREILVEIGELELEERGGVVRKGSWGDEGRVADDVGRLWRGGAGV